MSHPMLLSISYWNDPLACPETGSAVQCGLKVPHKHRCCFRRLKSGSFAGPVSHIAVYAVETQVW